MKPHLLSRLETNKMRRLCFQPYWGHAQFPTLGNYRSRERSARKLMMPPMRGCLEARGWRSFPGPNGFWVRDGEALPNTWDGMVKALLLDYDWARDQQRQQTAGFIAIAESLGAVVRRLA